MSWLAAGIGSVLYLFVNYEYVVTRIYYIDDLTWADMIWGTILIVMVTEATRRCVDVALPITSLVFLAYGLFIARLEPMRLIDQLYMTTEGIFGQALAVSASFVIIFVVFGSFMEKTGVGQLFMDFAMALTGHTAGGPGKVSVVSSSLFGTISGSAVANVMVDGPISIPLMKRSGFKPHFAAGVEATASTGGQIMPPIMGAAAFVMAEFLAVPYGQIVIWAVIPAILYYVACFAAVHFEAKRHGIHGVPRSELPRMRIVMAERGHLFLPIVILLVVMYSGYSAPLAALAGTLACFPVAALRKSTRVNVTLAERHRRDGRGRQELARRRAGLRLRRHHDRRGDAVGPRHRVHAMGRGIVAGLPVHRAGHDHAGRDRARHRPADDAVLHPADRAADPRDHEARRDRAGGAHVRVLLRRALGDHAAGRARGVRRGRASPRRTCGTPAGRR